MLQKNAKVVAIDGFEDVPENDEQALKKAIAHQPVSVAIEAGGREFQLYESVTSLLPNEQSFAEFVPSIAKNYLAAGCLHRKLWD